MVRIVVTLMSCGLALLGGCAQFDALTDTGLNTQDSAKPVAATTALYVSPDAAAAVASYRTVYIAPANLANMQVIQPEGAPADPQWWVTEEEAQILQRAINYEYSIALSYQSEFTVVTRRAEAQLVINTAVVAIHPHVTRATIAKDGIHGGSITVSAAVVDAASDRVLVRSVDTHASDDIWAFNEVHDDDPALNRVFATWGVDLRRGILQLQNRADLSTDEPL